MESSCLQVNTVILFSSYEHFHLTKLYIICLIVHDLNHCWKDGFFSFAGFIRIRVVVAMQKTKRLTDFKHLTIHNKFLETMGFLRS